MRAIHTIIPYASQEWSRPLPQDAPERPRRIRSAARRVSSVLDGYRPLPGARFTVRHEPPVR